MLARLTIADFKALEGRSLTLHFGANEQTGEILEASGRPGGPADGRDPFSVVVRSGPVDQHWPQGTYTLDHPEHGPLELFMVPIGPDEVGMRYAISFS